MSRREGELTRSLDGGSVEILEFRPFRLEIIEGPDAGTTERFEQRAVTVGASAKSDLVVNDESVSRHHCLIEATESGYRLQDQGSRNGTRLFGCRVGWAILQPGSVFQIGASKVRFSPEYDEAIGTAELSRVVQFGRMLGVSHAMRELFATLARAATSDITVLIEAESGCGKDLAAEAIHASSRRSDGPFEIFDCASVPENLIESELFGHLRGAFTGATGDQQGAFARANGGTLFIDELGELPIGLQPKLLRVLDSGSFKPVGGQQQVDVDVRVVAATNRDLESMLEDGRFRLDLFHRLAVIRVRIPPLRERLDDIPMIFRHLLDQFAAQGRPIPDVGPDLVEKLKAYPWPGNVRELRNIVERGVALQQDFMQMKLGEYSLALETEEEVLPSEAQIPSEGPLPQYHAAKERLVDSWERRYCEEILKRTRGNISAAAREAGMHRKSLEYLLDKHDLKSKKRR
jgi:DNA-binding NtrC family response regulator